MKKVFIKKVHYLFFISTSLIAINILLIAIALSQYYGFTGSKLQKFNILNKTLDLTTLLAVEHITNDPYFENKDHGIVMELNPLGSDSIDFVYSFYDNCYDISEKYLSRSNKRVIGYTKKEGVDIIIVTNIQYYLGVWNMLSNYITPQNEIKIFNYIYYSNNIAKEWYRLGNYEPWFWHFKYYNGIIYDKYRARR